MATGFRSAAAVLPCAELAPNVEFFESFGFRLDMIAPADDPTVAELSGYGLRIRLERGEGAPGTLRLEAHTASAQEELFAPNGTRVLINAETALEVPPLVSSFVLSRVADARWVEGRAGMRYRDLIPDRQGGRYIASHIQIRDAGPVPDYVHHHQILFQAIYVQRGWVEVVYESHGDPIVMREGDCVLQPPHIRHRVLSCSAGLEVVEIACPGAHPTFREHDLALPTKAYEREFTGQRFIHHIAAGAPWRPSSLGEARDTGLAQASAGLVDVQVLREIPTDQHFSHDGELCMFFVSAGSASFTSQAQEQVTLAVGDSVAIPAGMSYAFFEPTADFELLRIASPATLTALPHPQMRRTS
ncbi:MAG: cupin [Polyangiaceae bacterium]